MCFAERKVMLEALLFHLKKRSIPMYKFLITLVALLSFCSVNSEEIRSQKNLMLPRDPNYGTHIYPLTATILNTQGPVLEMGAGHYSTPLLHLLCLPSRRFLLTTESNAEFFKLFTDLQCSWHRLEFISTKIDGEKAWDKVGCDTHWSVVFVDHDPAPRRITDIMRLRKNTDIFVIHDTQPGAPDILGTLLQPLLSTFKYRFTYDRYTPYTSVVSDTIDVTSFFKN